LVRPFTEKRWMVRNREMSFLSYALFNTRDCMVPKNGMKCNQPMPAGGRLDSSRFSEQMSEHNKACPARGIAKKDISLFPPKNPINAIVLSFLGGI